MVSSCMMSRDSFANLDDIWARSLARGIPVPTTPSELVGVLGVPVDLALPPVLKIIPCPPLVKSPLVTRVNRQQIFSGGLPPALRRPLWPNPIPTTWPGQEGLLNLDNRRVWGNSILQVWQRELSP